MNYNIPMKEISPLSVKVYDYIQKYIESNGYSPSLRDMSKKFKTSTSAINHSLGILEGRGLIKRDPVIARSIRLVKQEGEKEMP